MLVENMIDKRERPRKFVKGDLVLLRDKRHELKGMHNKYESLWKGPFKVI